MKSPDQHASKSTPAKPPIKEPETPAPIEAAEQGEFGEGNYKATREYNDGLKKHLANHDVEQEARAAAPRSSVEADEMNDAEAAGLARARGEDTPLHGEKL